MSDFSPPSEPSQESLATAEPGWYFDGTHERWWDGAAWGPVQTNSDDATFATLAHLGVVFGGIILPLVLFLISKDGRRPETRHHAREALNFQLAFLVLYVPIAIGYTVYIVMLGASGQNEPGPGFFVGFGLFMVFALVMSVVALVLGVRGAMRANKGERYRYPVTIRFLKE